MSMRLQRRVSVLIGLLLGVVFTYGVLEQTIPKAWTDHTFSADAWELDPPLAVPTLVSFASGVTTDDALYRAIRAYYAANAPLLAAEFRETNSERLRGLFGMYLVHRAAPYNVVPVEPVTLLDFVSTPTAHCGTYARAAGQVYAALDVGWRNIVVDDGWHGLNEVWVAGRWETFDPTNNLWLSVSVDELLNGVPRGWRTFYTPQTDLNAPAWYRERLIPSYNLPAIRANISQWGLTVFPGRWEIAAESGRHDARSH